MLSLSAAYDVTLDPNPPKNLGCEVEHQRRVRRVCSSPAVTGHVCHQQQGGPQHQQQEGPTSTGVPHQQGEAGQIYNDAGQELSAGQQSVSAPTPKLRACSADFECSICSDIVYLPVVGPCGHDFCLSCLRQWAAVSTRSKPSGKFHCPICRTELPYNLGVCHRLKSVMEFCFPEQLERRRQELDLQENKLQGPNKGLLYTHLSLVRAPNPVTFEAAIQEQQQQRRRQQQQQHELQQLTLELNSMLTPDMSAQMLASLPTNLTQHSGSWGGGHWQQQAVFPSHEPESTFAEAQRNLPPRPGSAGQVSPWRGGPNVDSSRRQPPCMLLHDQAGGVRPHEQAQGTGQAPREPEQQPATVPIGVPVPLATVGRGAVQFQQGGAAAEADGSISSSPPAAAGHADPPGAAGRPPASEARHVSWGCHHARAHSEELMHSRHWACSGLASHPEPPASVAGSSSCAGASPSPHPTQSPSSRHKHSSSGSSSLLDILEGKVPSRPYSRVPSNGRRCSYETASASQAEGGVLSSALRLGLNSLRTPSEYASQGSASHSHRGSEGGVSQMCTHNSIDSECPMSTVSTAVAPTSRGSLASERRSSTHNFVDSCISGTCGGGGVGGGSSSSSCVAAGAGAGIHAGFPALLSPPQQQQQQQQHLCDAVGQGLLRGGGSVGGSWGPFVHVGTDASAADLTEVTSSIESLRALCGAGDPDGLPGTPRAGGHQAAQAANHFFGSFSPRRSGGASPAGSGYGGSRRAQSPAQGSYGPGSHSASPRQPHSPASGSSPTHSRPPTMASSPFASLGSSCNNSGTHHAMPPSSTGPSNATSATSAARAASHNPLHTPPLAQTGVGGLAAWGLWTPHSSLAHASAAHAHHPLAHAPSRDFHLHSSNAPQPPFLLSALQPRGERSTTAAAAAAAAAALSSAAPTAERDAQASSATATANTPPALAAAPPLHPSVAPYLPSYAAGLRKPALPTKQHSAPHSPPPGLLPTRGGSSGTSVSVNSISAVLAQARSSNQASVSHSPHRPYSTAAVPSACVPAAGSGGGSAPAMAADTTSAAAAAAQGHQGSGGSRVGAAALHPGSSGSGSSHRSSGKGVSGSSSSSLMPVHAVQRDAEPSRLRGGLVRGLGGGSGGRSGPLPTASSLGMAGEPWEGQQQQQRLQQQS